MRARWLGVAGIALFGLVAGACGGGDDLEGADEEPVETAPIDGAVEIAQLSLPADLSDSAVADLIEDLCSAGGGGAGALAARLQAVPITDQAQLAAAIDALAAGAEGYCPDDVDPAVDALQAAVAPTTTTPAASAEVVAGSPSGSSGSTGAQRSGSTATSGPGSNSSSGTASTGSGNATGTGNSSGTEFTQSVGSGSSNSSSSGTGGASSSTTG